MINQEVLAFAEAHVGQEVGNGQCTDLVAAAYGAAGAESESKLGPTGPDANYVWGTPVDTVTTANRSLAGVLPGDVIQFSDVTLVHTTTYPNGSWVTTTQTAEHHTAIVESVSGSTIFVLEQNVGSATTPDSVRYTRAARDLRPERFAERDDVDLSADQPRLGKMGAVSTGAPTLFDESIVTTSRGEAC